MIRRLVVLGLLLQMGHALATPVAAPHVEVELVSDVASVQAGRDATLGVRFVPARGWHVYWRNPGDSGEAPKVAWTLPPGFRAGEIEWPVPARIPLGPLANFGYPGPTLLPVVLHVPRDLAGLTAVNVEARATWLVCNDEGCVPGAATLTLALPVGAGAPRPTGAMPLFAAARAELPVAPPGDWRFTATADPTTLSLVVRGIAGPVEPPPFFFPYAREEIENAAPQDLHAVPEGFRLELQRWAGARAMPRSIDGVLTIGERAYAISVPVAGPGIALWPLAFAFAGGLLLNLMPCVFPVLMIKAFGIIRLAGEGRRQVRQHAIAYTLGVLASFWALASVLLAVRAGGAPLGWGFQLQSPAVVAALAALFFWMALALLGASTIGGSLMGVGTRLTAGGGWRGAFFTGVLATVVATPCSAPFMGTALGYALVQPPATALGVFTALGLGLAFPYLAISWVPALSNALPRPGRWMETLKELLAFPLLGTVVWLTWVASLQGGPTAVAAILTMLVLLGLAAWVTNRFAGRGARATAAVLAVVVLAVGVSIRPAAAPRASDLAWEPYSTVRLGELLREGKPVFIDFTAAWCLTCQVNQRLALSTPAVIAKMRALGVVAVRADWTTPDPDVTRALQQFGRDGVPLYVLYSGRPDDPPRILPQLLTRDLVITELEQLETRRGI